MNVNILADFRENGVDKNEPHIVCGTDDEIVAGAVIKKQLENRGCKVQSLIVIDGVWTLEQLHDMANYGDNFDKVTHRIIYLSGEMIDYLNKIRNNPAEAQKINDELNIRMQMRKKR